MAELTKGWSRPAWLTPEKYGEMYRRSIENPDAFWAEEAKRLDWFKPWNKVKNTSFLGEAEIKWFEGGSLNVSHNCLDRHLAKRGDQTAILWEADNPSEPSRKITYRELHADVCKFSNVLRSIGVGKGDRVTLYMPMVPEAAVAMLACTRIGAIHSVIFGGFSPESIAGRITDCDSQYVVTADEGLRGGKKIPLKSNVDEALKKCPGVKKVIVLKRTGGAISWNPDRDLWWSEVMNQASPQCEALALDA
ncbi:MAG: AMP-binding protein, partial [Bdellovibrionota bacterium]